MTADATAPTMSVRTLARLSSDPDVADEKMRLQRAKKERAEVWQKAVAIRKQHWKIVLWSKASSKAADYKTDLIEARSSSKVAVELNERHRAMVLCADLCGEPAVLPWTPGPLEKITVERLKAMATAMSELESESTFTFFFDGRSKESRKMLEDVLAKASSTEVAELWISYAKPAPHRNSALARGCSTVFFCCVEIIYFGRLASRRAVKSSEQTMVERFAL